MAKARYQVFVSSTYEDLIEERKQVTQAILECECFPAGMELFPASNKSQWNFIKQVIDESDIYLVIIAGRYGSIKGGKRPISYTEMEFNYAKKIKKPIIALIHRNIDELPAKKVEKTDKSRELLTAFTETAKNGRLVKFWHNEDDLKSSVITSLTLQKEQLKDCGWIRLNAALTNNVVDISTDLITKNKELTELLSETNSRNLKLDKSLANRTKEVEKLQRENAALKNIIATNNADHLDLKLKHAQTECVRLNWELSSYKLAYNQLEQEISDLRKYALTNIATIIKQKLYQEVKKNGKL